MPTNEEVMAALQTLRRAKQMERRREARVRVEWSNATRDGQGWRGGCLGCNDLTQTPIAMIRLGQVEVRVCRACAARVIAGLQGGLR